MERRGRHTTPRSIRLCITHRHHKKKVKYVSYDIVFREIPDEVTLAINLSGCPIHCKGCHSPHLWQDIGDPLTTDRMAVLLDEYRGLITCVCLMGGDAEPQSVQQLLQFARRHADGIRTAWYSGRNEAPAGFDLSALDYLKLGPYMEQYGPLDKPTTNQRLLRIHPDGTRTDITHRLQKKG